MTDRAIRNARIVLPDRVIDGSLLIEKGCIARIDEGRSAIGEDWEGDYLLPGLVELHTDHIESHYKPRPGVTWDARLAAQAHDAQIAASGITTVFDALCVGLDERRLSGRELRALIDAVQDQQAKGLLRAEHFTHLRCEVSSPDILAAYEAFEGEGSVRLVSLMDHTPGQRQFQRLDQHRLYFQGRNGLSDAAYEAFVAKLTAQAARYSDPHRREIAARAQARGVALASHDDATAAHVAEAVRDGVSVAAFPTTVEAAEASRRAGMAVLMGAPNIVRGGSHSGNVAAGELAGLGALDILSSDYVPYALLQAAFLLAEFDGYDLPRAVRAVSKTPAEALGLHDRGALLPERRADIVRVRLDHADETAARPIARAVYVRGCRVA